MKAIKKLTLWIVISLFVQFLGFYYVDSKFLSSASNVTIKKIEDFDADEKEYEDADVKISDNASKIQFSHNCKYLSYIEKNHLYVQEIKSEKIKKVQLEDNSEISYYKWLPDRDRMLIVEKNSGYNGIKLMVSSYDVKKDDKILIKDFKVYDENIEVSDIELSTLTGLTYIKTVDSDNVSSIYRIDRMGEGSKIETVPKYISNMSLLRTEDILYYEGEVYNKIYSSQDNKEINIDGVDKLTLLGTDNEKNIYVGSLKNDLVESIYYKTIESKQNLSEETDIEKLEDEKNEFVNDYENDFTQIKMTSPSKSENIFINSEGKIYVHDKTRKTVTNEIDKSVTTYNGEFLSFRNDGIMVRNGQNISVIKYKK